jgi:2-keto-4-pentenoate hydratase
MIEALYRLSRTAVLDDTDRATLAADDVSDVDAGLDLQLAVLRSWTSAGAGRAGWKIGLTSGRGRDSMGAGVRPFGYVLADRVFPSGATVSVPAGAKVEPEICVVLGTDLRGDVTREQAVSAVAAFAPAFEIVTAALPAGMSTAVRLGNDLNQWGIVVGPTTDAVDPASVVVTLSRDGVQVGSAGAGPDVLDDPYLSLARVAARLAAHGEYLRAGDRVITGSLLPAEVVAPGTTWRADFTSLGTVEVTIA